MICVARTDSEAATLITTTIDARDHPFILGSTNPSLPPLSQLMVSAQAEGKFGDELQKIEDDWLASAKLMLFDDAVIAAIGPSNTAQIKKYKEKSAGKNNLEACKVAQQILGGKEVFFDWEAPRTREGFYRYQGGTSCAVMRARAYAPYSDMCWMESKKPDYQQAREFAEGVHAVWPQQKLAYNLSPSFNWKCM